MISGSSLGRARCCPASEALPHDHRQSDDAARGTVIHEFLADCLNHGRKDALAAVPPEYLDACDAIDIAWLPAARRGEYGSEAAYIYNVRTGETRAIVTRHHRDYGHLEDGDIPCTLDIVGIRDAGRYVEVMDYKTGFGVLEDAYASWQMRFGAMVATAVHAPGAARAKVRLIRVPPDGREPYVSDATFDAVDLDLFAEEVRDIYDAVADAREAYEDGKTLDVTSGPHCRYCPAMHVCPAQGALVASVIREPDRPIISITDDADVAWVWPKIKAAREMLDRVDDACKLYAETRQVDLGDGRALGPRVINTDTVVDTQGARDALVGIYGPAIADAATKVRVTKTGVKAAARLHAQATGQTIKAATDEMVEALTSAGVMQKITTVQVREMPAPKEKADA